MMQEQGFLTEIGRLIEAGDFQIAIAKCDALIKALKTADPEIKNPEHLQAYIYKATILSLSNNMHDGLQLCNELLNKYPENTKLLNIKYVCLLAFPKQAEEMEATFQQLTQNDKTEWVALADYLRSKHKLNKKSELEKLKQICTDFPKSQVALYLYAHTVFTDPAFRSAFVLSPVDPRVFEKTTPELRQKMLHAAILESDFNQLHGLATYSRPKFFTGLRTTVNLDKIWQKTDNEKDKILALLCTHDDEYLNEAILFCNSAYLAKDLEVRVFQCIAEASKRNFDKKLVYALYQNLTKQFPGNIFVLSLQPFLKNVMQSRAVDFNSVWQQKIAEKEKAIAELPEDAAPNVREALENEITQLKRALEGAEKQPAETKDPGCVCF